MAPPPLPDDVIPDILLRLPSDDPAGLVRASAVCKTWRRIITDPAFPGRYRALHPTAPVLGFLHSPKNPELPRFVSTTSFRPAAADHRHHPLDCRHGRVVFYDYGSLDFNGVLGGYIVCDPVTGELHKLPDVPDVFTRPAVVCAASGDCDDHRSCSGGPFIVAFVGVENIPATYYFDAHACFYASDTRRWSLHLNIHLDHGRYYPDDCPAALVGDSLYFYCRQGILRYRYGLLRRLGGIRGMISTGIGERAILSMMELPKWKHLGIGKSTSDVVVMAAEGGGLGLACLGHKTRTMLYLLARDTEGAIGDDATAWVQRRVIDLKMLLPVGNNPKWQPCLKGVSQEANVIFVSTEDGIFSIDLGGSSLQARKVCKKGVVHDWMHPFVSFYTESLLFWGQARRSMAAPLPDDVIPGILLRIPPDDPAGLVRASAVCKTWRHIITDPTVGNLTSTTKCNGG